MAELKTVLLFRNLDERDLAALRKIVQEKHFSSGQEVFHEGAPGDGIYAVKTGLVEISTNNADTRVPLSQILPGEVFGEMAVIENKPRSANAIATEATVVWFIPRDEMLKLIERSPALAFSLLQIISRRLREFNRHYLSEVVQAERLSVIGRFTNSILHDLKNPLSIISLSTELLSSNQTALEKRARYAGHVRQQVERINDLISDVLEFTRGSPSSIKLEPTNYAAFVTEVVEELRPDAEMKSAQLTFENPPPEISLSLNPKRLRRVFYNLVHNATDAMPRGGKIIFRFMPGETELLTEIEDTGPGIAPEIAGHLFKAFATHGKTHGTGLGLSICKKIIEDHGGRIWARNEPGRGAMFAFALPL